MGKGRRELGKEAKRMSYGDVDKKKKFGGILSQYVRWQNSIGLAAKEIIFSYL